MSLELLLKKVRQHDAVLWKYAGPSGYGGSKYDSPKQIKVRWMEQAEVLSDNNGNEFVSRAEIILAEDVGRKSRIWLGKLDDLTEDQQSNPMQVENSYEIKRIDKKTRLGRSDYLLIQAWI